MRERQANKNSEKDTYLIKQKTLKLHICVCDCEIIENLIR